MNGSEPKFSKIVSTLIKLTRNGKLNWDREDPPASLKGIDEKINIVFTTNYKERRLRLYEKQYKAYDAFSDTYYWDQTVVLELIDYDDRTEWDFPFVSEMWDLLEAVKYQTADVEGFIETFFEDEED